MKNIIEVSDDSTSSENWSSISENETYSEYDTQDNKNYIEKEKNREENKNIDISRLLGQTEKRVIKLKLIILTNCCRKNRNILC